MISNKMTDALSEQINAELWSAYLYLAMSVDASAKALKGVANWFFVQWLEEQDHARIIKNYLEEQNAKAELKPINAVRTTWPSALEMFRDALAHEKEVTKLIGDLVRLSFDERDVATLSRLQWFVDEQVEEEKAVMDLLDEFEAVGSDAFSLRLLDKDLAQRQYHPASAL